MKEVAKEIKTSKGLSILKKSLIVIYVICITLLTIYITGTAGLYLLMSIGLSPILSSLIASQLSILILAFVYFNFNIKKVLGLYNKRIEVEHLFLALKATMFVLIINVLIASLFEVGGETTSTVDELVNEVSFGLSIFLPMIIAPLFEELAIRAGLKFIFVDKYKFSNISYILISSIIFGALHFSSFNAIGLVQVIVTGLMGAIYAIYYIKTDSIYVSMLSHLLYNGLVMFSAYYLV